ncbi:MAG: SBBP repeat-containing protein [Bryobacteraceae bacterium]
MRWHAVRASLEPSSVRFSIGGHAVRLVFPGSRPDTAPQPAVAPTGHANVLVGREPGEWRRDLPIVSAVVYRDLYPGVDLYFLAEAGRQGPVLKSEFHVAAGADPAVIRMRYAGAASVSLDEAGALRVAAGGDEMRENAPVVYQRDGDRVRAVESRFRLEGDEAAFALGGYDSSLGLIIDPVLAYSSYFGGSRIDNATAVAGDSAGNAYVAGWTDSSDLTLQAPIGAFRGSVDAFVYKVGPSGAVVWATYMGGTGDDRAQGIAVDSAGTTWVTGYTSSTNFPLANQLQGTRSGGRDVFVARINAAGSALMMSTYWGGAGNDEANSITVDQFNQAYIAGETYSANFPTRAPFQASNRGGRDGFLFKIGINGQVSFSTYVGGSGDDVVNAVGISQNLTPYIAGCTSSSNFPTRNPQQPSLSGGQDGFVIRFDGDAAKLIFGTYLGGNGGGVGRTECVNAMALDSFGNAYVTGVTSSTNFPLVNAFQNSRGGSTYDAFVTKLNSDGLRLYSSYLGGRGLDAGTAIRVDSSRRAWVGGYTSSNNFPVASAAQSNLGGLYDAFVARVSTAGNSIEFSTYLGGSSSDTLAGIALGGSNVFAAGLTASSDFPVAGAGTVEPRGSGDSWLTAITP